MKVVHPPLCPSLLLYPGPPPSIEWHCLTLPNLQHTHTHTHAYISLTIFPFANNFRYSTDSTVYGDSPSSDICSAERPLVLCGVIVAVLAVSNVSRSAVELCLVLRGVGNSARFETSGSNSFIQLYSAIFLGKGAKIL